MRSAAGGSSSGSAPATLANRLVHSGCQRTTWSRRFEEALEVIVPLLRGGRADFEGTYHAARDLEQRPRGPRPGRIPIMIGAGGRRARPGRRHADIGAAYVQERSDLAEFAPRLAALEAVCREIRPGPSFNRVVGPSIIVEPDSRSSGAEALYRCRSAAEQRRSARRARNYHIGPDGTDPGARSCSSRGRRPRFLGRPRSGDRRLAAD